MKTRSVLPIILCILTVLGAAYGQQTQYDKGTPPQLAAGVSAPGSYMSTELGTVNLSNGGLNLNIPLGTVGGRGNVALPLMLSYSSKVWSASMDVDTERESGTEQSVAYADYDNQSSFGGASAPGWTLRARIYMSSNFVRIRKITVGESTGCYTYGLHKLTLNLPDKGEVEFATMPPTARHHCLTIRRSKRRVVAGVGIRRTVPARSSSTTSTTESDCFPHRI